LSISKENIIKKSAKARAANNALRIECTTTQRDVMRHMTAAIGHGYRMILPQPGMHGEISQIAIGVTSDDVQEILRLDRIPPINGISYMEVLNRTFTDFPAALYPLLNLWIPASAYQKKQ
jgi:hypothetical protein